MPCILAPLQLNRDISQLAAAARSHDADCRGALEAGLRLVRDLTKPTPPPRLPQGDQVCPPPVRMPWLAADAGKIGSLPHVVPSVLTRGHLVLPQTVSSSASREREGPSSCWALRWCPRRTRNAARRRVTLRIPPCPRGTRRSIQRAYTPSPTLHGLKPYNCERNANHVVLYPAGKSPIIIILITASRAKI